MSIGNDRSELLEQDRVWVDFKGEVYLVTEMSIRYKLNLLLWLQKKSPTMWMSDHPLTTRLYKDVIAGEGGTAGDEWEGSAKKRRYTQRRRYYFPYDDEDEVGRPCGCPAFDCNCLY